MCDRFPTVTQQKFSLINFQSGHVIDAFTYKPWKMTVALIILKIVFSSKKRNFLHIETILKSARYFRLIWSIWLNLINIQYPYEISIGSRFHFTFLRAMIVNRNREIVTCPLLHFRRDLVWFFFCFQMSFEICFP